MHKPTIIIAQALESEHVTINSTSYNFVNIYTGFGKTQAIVGLLKAINTYQPIAVINVGTAGSAMLPIGSIAVCTSFVDRDLKLLEKLGSVFLITSNTTNDVTNTILNNETKYTCNTGDQFVCDKLTDGDVCDMEAFAQASLCNELRLPFVAVKYVTDIVGQNSLKDWESKLNEAQIGLTDFFCEKLI